MDVFRSRQVTAAVRPFPQQVCNPSTFFRDREIKGGHYVIPWFDSFPLIVRTVPV